MPISTSSFGDERDKRYEEYTSADDYEEEVLDFLGLSPEQAETILKRLGGGVEEKLRRVEGIGWIGLIEPMDAGVQIIFKAHDELLDDLVRRFESWADRELGA